MLRAEGTKAELMTEYLDRHVATKRKPRTHVEDRKLFKGHIAPAIGKDHPRMANVALAVVRAFIGWAEREGVELPRRGC